MGLDFGTNSVRALIVRCRDGFEVGSGVASYPSGNQGILHDPKDPLLARQHPGDYLVALPTAVRAALRAARLVRGFTPDRIIGLGVDATGSSPLPVDARNQPLALDPRWRRSLAAQCWLWKDHTSWREAARITEFARTLRPQYLAACGGVYSSEWFWSKIWHCRNVAPEVFAAAHSWVELSDWIGSVLGGVKKPGEIVRSLCLAGFKAMYSDRWHGLPDRAFLRRLDPALAALRERLFDRAANTAASAGRLDGIWAPRLGLPAGIPIANAGLDCQAGAIGGGVGDGTLVKIIGTSACDCAAMPAGRDIPRIPGICGAVPDAVLPDHVAIEAGQAAVGDIFKWWVEVICEGDSDLHSTLARDAARLPPGGGGLLALDWHNGNRNLLCDPQLTGLMLGCTLQTTRAEIYRALIEATAFGARAILERLRTSGVPVRRIVSAGGIAEKNPLLLQIYADVLGCPIELAASPQACALGSAIAAAVVAGAHQDFPTAQRAMTHVKDIRYRPNPRNRRIYDRLFAQYRALHDAFGGLTRRADVSRVMKELILLRDAGAVKDASARTGLSRRVRGEALGQRDLSRVTNRAAR
jgi:L-ribulokinase